ncbi:hypothetical protein [Endozoicomonas sp. GU-1]|uniref:hypothetical protein n=1 Tax=Endozoicomonas sp. GU-1 TaxID=3009078 RepID=UPI0022B42448|nr:hypothetical protein [Endozoicomonas sp. GU-1]WBA81511.1 hypothetical protein O2T12_25100 [Endozoicomonas sp. GU-1]WBA84459.1 hypothetical protein O3276_14260 [Endozoicomonas sp. GU-1]
MKYIESKAMMTDFEEDRRYFFNKNTWPLIFVILFVCDFFSPEWSPRQTLMSIDIDTQKITQSGGSITKQLFWSLLLIYLFYEVLRDKKQSVINIVYTNWYLSPLLVLCVISFFWSDFPAATIKRSVLQIMIFLVVCLAVYRTKNIDIFEKTLYISGLAILFLELTTIIIMPSFAFSPDGALAGIHSHKNVLGYISAIFFVISLHTVHKYRKKDGIFFIRKVAAIVSLLWLIVLLLSKSKTSIAITLFFGLTYAFLGMKYLKYFSYFMLILLSFFVIYIAAGYIFSFDPLQTFTIALDRVDLTGRGIYGSFSFLLLYKNQF